MIQSHFAAFEMIIPHVIKTNALEHDGFDPAKVGKRLELWHHTRCGACNILVASCITRCEAYTDVNNHAWNTKTITNLVELAKGLDFTEAEDRVCWRCAQRE